MKTTALMAALMVSVSLAFAGGSGEGASQTTDTDTAAAQSQALGLYPEHFQFATLTEFEQAAGTSITGFGEAPMLAEMVARGELPPVEERLPVEPLVVVRNAIGTYGGTLRTAHDGTATAVIQTINKFLEQMPYTFDPAGATAMTGSHPRPNPLLAFRRPVSVASSGFGEAPMLAEMVARGELPPVEERLPVEPLVVVRNAIGTYGGTLRPRWDCWSGEFRQMPYTGLFGPNILSTCVHRTCARECAGATASR